MQRESQVKLRYGYLYCLLGGVCSLKSLLEVDMMHKAQSLCACKATDTCLFAAVTVYGANNSASHGTYENDNMHEWMRHTSWQHHSYALLIQLLQAPQLETKDLT